MQQIASEALPADAVISRWFRTRRDLADVDRAQILDLVYDVLRHHARLNWWLDRVGSPNTPSHRLFAWLVLDGTPPKRVDGLFAQAQGASLPKAERELLYQLHGSPIDHPDMPDKMRLECPDWAIDGLQQRFGERFDSEMRAALGNPPLDLRINPLKTTREAMLSALRQLGLKPEPMSMSPLGIRLAERMSLAKLPMLKTGEVEIQDEGSQLVAMLVEARAGDRVVDFCAGAGGKTLAIGADMANKGYVVACDINEMRLKRAAERFRKAGLHNIETRLLSSETDRWVKRHKEGFGRVLVDAPCSGTGTWRRNPDARWRPFEEEGLDQLVLLQGRILASAARLVKPGGRLVYATCSLLQVENEDQITAFLAARPDFRIVPLRSIFGDLPSDHPDHLSLTPAQHRTDGFFAAVLQRDGGVSSA